MKNNSRLNDAIEERFWSKVNKTKTCWLWTASCSRIIAGYGIFWSNKTISSHRFSWELHNGPIPKGLYVLHKCDITICVNPEHLFLGNAQDNANDKVQKNRQQKGNDISNKLTEKQVLYIRSRPIYRGSQVKLAKEFGVLPSTINNIIKRRNWKHI